MKLRFSFVSNSSSSSFLVPKKVEGIPCIRLPKEIWKRIEKNFLDYNEKHLDLSSESEEWWLTELVCDCTDAYDDVSKIKNSHAYLDGNDEPYGYYDNEDDYVVFKKDGDEFFVQASHLSSAEEGIPEIVKLRDSVNEILSSKLNQSQKLAAIKNLFKF